MKTQTQPEVMGATVVTCVHVDRVGDALRRLEHHADVILIDRQPHPMVEYMERWTLRSLEFPRTWDGRRVSLVVSEGQQGFASFDLR